MFVLFAIEEYLLTCDLFLECPTFLVDILAAHEDLSVDFVGVKLEDVCVDHCTAKFSRLLENILGTS